MAPRPITPEETARVDELIVRARAALREFEGATQAEVDRLCQAVAWAVANEETFTRLAAMGVEESGIGDPVSRVGKRLKVMGILRDVLRQPSVGVIEELPERGIVKYAKPVGVIASLVPTTNPELTPPGVGHVRAQVPRRRDLLAPSAQPPDDPRDGRDHAPRARARGRAGGRPPMPRPTEHPRGAVPHEPGRPRPGNRRPGHGEGGVQLGDAGLRRRCRKLDDGHRRDRRRRRGRVEHPAEQDVRLRVRLLGGRQPASSSRPSTTPSATGSWRRAGT